MASLGRFGGLGIVACTLGCGLVLDTGASGGPGDAFTDGGSARSDADLADGETGADALPPPECDDTSDCEPLHGAAPCSGDWVCTPEGYCGVMCPGCTDGDLDGFGPENTCRGADCDDSNFFVHDNAIESCEYAGPDDTRDVGACVAATRECTDGAWTDCIGEILPAGEACNGIDDDCNGVVDDLPPLACGTLGSCATSIDACTTAGAAAACPPLPRPIDALDTACDGVDDDCDGFVDEDCGDCVYAASSRLGVPAPADPTNPATPILGIQAAIDHARMLGGPRRVCVFADPGCAPVRFDEEIRMEPGISVHGNYDPALPTRQCSGAVRTEIESRETGVSVEFPSSIAGPTITELAHMRVFYGQTGTAVAAIRVAGATGVSLADVTVISGTTAPAESVGIELRDGAEAIVTRSSIDLPPASGIAVGVRAVGSRVVMRQSCGDTTGLCDAVCTSVGPGIHATSGAGARVATGTTAGVWLEDAAGSVIDAVRVCGSTAVGPLAAVRITGDTSGVVITQSALHAFGTASEAYGVHMDACRGGPARIVANGGVTASSGTATAPAEGIYAGVGCDAVIADNLTIAGANEGRGIGTGVRCAAGSQCYVIGNGIRGTTVGAAMPVRAVGLHCGPNSCLRVEKNYIEGGRGIDVIGARLERSGAVLDDNIVIGGCGSASSVGMDIVSSPVRLTNTLVRAGTCDATEVLSASPTFIGVTVSVSRAGAEPDVHSNLLDGGGLSRMCSSMGLLFEPGTGGHQPSGLFRNNVLLAGSCDTAQHVMEAGPDADPRTLEHNAFDLARAFAYVDEGVRPPLGTLAEVEGLTDMRAAGSIDVGCDHSGPLMDPQLPATSPCVDAGKEHGAPSHDMHGQERDSMPDIGPDEYVP